MADLRKRYLAVFAAVVALAAGVAVHPAPFVQRVEAVVARVTGRVGNRVVERVAAPAGSATVAAETPEKKDPGAPTGFNPSLPGCNATPAAAPKPAATPGAPPDFVTMGSCGDTGQPTAQPPARDSKKPGGH